MAIITNYNVVIIANIILRKVIPTNKKISAINIYDLILEMKYIRINEAINMWIFITYIDSIEF